MTVTLKEATVKGRCRRGGIFRDVSDVEIQARDTADAERRHNMHDRQRQCFDAKKDNFLKVRAAGPCTRRSRRSQLQLGTLR